MSDKRQKKGSKIRNKKNTISTYLKSKEFILKSCKRGRFAKGRKCMRIAAYEDLEEALVLQINNALQRNVYLSVPILACKAKELSLVMYIKNFNFSEG